MHLIIHEGGAVHVLGRVLEMTVSAVMFHNRVERDGLKELSANRQDDMISSFEYLVPAVLLELNLHVAKRSLRVSTRSQ
jgi:hypothetical protein